MKTFLLNFLVLIALSLVTLSGAFAQMGISNNGSSPDISAMLDVRSTTKGFLPPRVALTTINSANPITLPATGLLVFNTAIAGTSPNNAIPGYYYWNGTRWMSVVSPQGTIPGDMLYWNGTQWVRVAAGSNGQVLTFSNGVPAWGQPSSLCGISITINHVAGAVAPVTKTVTYGTILNIPGEPSKCWITSNLGSDHQATAVSDGTEASAGWYWQFNRKQGYKHDGTTRTPNTTWISSISQTSDWIAANDPCTIELGAGWRIPTYTEWTNVDASGNCDDWNGPWNSALKMHAAGYLDRTYGSLWDCGSNGSYLSSTQRESITAWCLYFDSEASDVGFTGKPYGCSVRCLRE